MQHTSIPDPPGFNELSPEEQLLYVQALWERVIERFDEQLPVPESHLRTAEERLAAYRKDPSRARDAYEVLDRIQRRLG